MDGCAAAQAQVGADALQLVAVARRQAQGRAGAGKLQRQFARDYRGGAHYENPRCSSDEDALALKRFARA